ncbi:MAG TPA: enoyl-CoA hydratase-related protein, partial [Deinococcales bacterium]|nr:enoyl-CoA hydratase-related protein [Deinococcales bacterium]
MIPEVGVERVDGVDVILLRRPKVMNALNAAMLDALRAAVTGSTAPAIVLAAEGPNFCAGQDLRE